MNFKAEPTTIGNLLSLAKAKYIIPRFQREYSWGKDEVKQFYEDLLENLKIEENEISVGEYFISFIVAVGNKNTLEYQLVDGQQRMTTITIILAVLTHIFKEQDEKDLADLCFETYVQGKDRDAKPYFKLVNESPKPFFQQNIQNINISTDYIPKTEEEKKLKETYNFFKNNLLEEKIKKDLGVSKIKYLEILKSLRDQVLELKVIFITVDSIDDAYTIFETLNAKGKDLETIDLIKNKIFRILNQEHPTDEASEMWRDIKNKLKARNQQEKISKFFRHFWISKYKFVTEGKIYNSFNKEIEQEIKIYRSFMLEMKNEADNYVKILAPLDSDWPQQNEKKILESLKALNLFGVEQYRTLCLSLFDAKKRRVISTKTLTNAMLALEKFHFIFTAICSSRPSGLEGKYSTISKKIRQSTNRTKTNDIVKELEEYFKELIPGKEVFEEKFSELIFLKNKEKHKKIILYIMKKFEELERKTEELKIFNITLEHILPQSKSNNEKIGQIGNLLPLSGGINSLIGNKSFDKKIIELEKSELFYTQRFVKENKEKLKWELEDIEKRTIKMAEKSYNVIWKI